MVKIFYSYSHFDKTYQVELEKHLSVLKRNHIIEEWHDREILAGTELKPEIDDNLISSDIILLLISADFLASNYCYDIEMKKAFEMYDAGHAIVVPIIIRPCIWLQDARLSKLKALPTDGLAVTKWQSADEAWADIAKGINNLCEAIEKHKMKGKTIVAQSSKNDFSISSILGIIFEEKINLLNSELFEYSNKSCVKITNSRGFDRAMRWPAIVINGHSEITDEGIRYLGDENTYKNVRYRYVMDLKNNGTLMYGLEKLEIENGAPFFMLEEYINDVVYFCVYSRSWINNITKHNPLERSAEFFINLNIPEQCYLGISPELIRDEYVTAQKNSKKEINCSISVAIEKSFQDENIIKICTHFIRALISEFSYTINKKVKFPLLDERMLEQKILHILNHVQ